MTAPDNTVAAQHLLAQVTRRFGDADTFVAALRRSLDDPTDRLPRIEEEIPHVSPPGHLDDTGIPPSSASSGGRHALREDII
ncbi:hypothetical protein AB0C65_35540 [Nocardia sp. NPDC048505]|uniref:hypothetical protein n=1 Tax=Nocardia sp. NPDC048505 TaxID=3155756 RepID=UPI0033EE677C